MHKWALFSCAVLQFARKGLLVKDPHCYWVKEHKVWSKLMVFMPRVLPQTFLIYVMTTCSEGLIGTKFRFLCHIKDNYSTTSSSPAATTACCETGGVPTCPSEGNSLHKALDCVGHVVQWSLWLQISHCAIAVEQMLWMPITLAIRSVMNHECNVCCRSERHGQACSCSWDMSSCQVPSPEQPGLSQTSCLELVTCWKALRAQSETCWEIN